MELSSLSEEDNDDVWALELEEELDLAADLDMIQSGDQLVAGIETMEEEQVALDKPSMVMFLPHEVLIIIISFGQVGRVCKSWSLASIAVARRRFSSRLTDILRPLNVNALAVALDVEAELHAAYGQRCVI
ncbi:hypothetical protein F443_04612 [Plasmopara halstedii]|uniref:F-box domain n=1 Tax=Plasmopara halstedii TaxID=4781 RepID=A0A0P1AD35_PLAHL|nr:hypothetical protein F443_04612 [Plasmopara halstedii]CEG38381.1 hypothetical protein F443_04612 [Plasmopara halstedii]|eukprot:XP_024574750.1 hypothetical protein F443_04612 [Plasmopara halstedii]